MKNTMIIQGRELSSNEIDFIRQLIKANPSWHRTRLSKEICLAWFWKRPNGELKDIACRSMLRKLHDRDLIELPPPRHEGHRKRKIIAVDHCTDSINEPLSFLRPIHLIETHQAPQEDNLFTHLLNSYHYLGLKASFVGENLRYLAFDKNKRPLACLLFGAAAWKTEARDNLIGWDQPTREKNLSLITNNTRFLILPWVTSKHLASHLLSLCLKRVNDDWKKRYGHSVFLVETFVDTTRFQGTCYQAANWIRVGQTKGRGRQDRYNNLRVPVKHVYVYPLDRNFRRRLNR